MPAARRPRYPSSVPVGRRPSCPSSVPIGPPDLRLELDWVVTGKEEEERSGGEREWAGYNIYDRYNKRTRFIPNRELIAIIKH